MRASCLAKDLDTVRLPSNEMIALDAVDESFDSVYPERLRCRSKRHWTPVAVAERAAQLLVTSCRTRVLDVGSGTGKFCIIGALATQGRFCGVERNASLAEAACDAASRYGVEKRARFVHGDIRAIDWSEFDAFYFYNPFSETLDGIFGALERTLGASAHLKEEHIRFTRAQLANARSGTRVVTYHGFGGTMPDEYRCIRREGWGTDFVELWVKDLSTLWLPPFDSCADAKSLEDAPVMHRPASAAHNHLHPRGS